MSPNRAGVAQSPPVAGAAGRYRDAPNQGIAVGVGVELDELADSSSRIRRGLAALVLLLSATVLTTTTASAEPEAGRPFRISVSSDFLNQPEAEECATGVQPGIITGTGRPTHMMGLTMTGETCGLVGVANWIAANADTISIEFNTLVAGPPNEDDSNPIAFQAFGVSGTGRFAKIEFMDEIVLVGLAWFFPDGSGGHLEAWNDTRIFYDASDRSGR